MLHKWQRQKYPIFQLYFELCLSSQEATTEELLPTYDPFMLFICYSRITALRRVTSTWHQTSEDAPDLRVACLSSAKRRRRSESPRSPPLSQLHLYNCAREGCLIWSEPFFSFFLAPTAMLPHFPLDGWDGWPRAWRSACRTVCEPTGLVFIWRLCHKRGGRDRAPCGSAKKTHRVSGTHTNTGVRY